MMNKRTRVGKISQVVSGEWISDFNDLFNTFKYYHFYSQLFRVLTVLD